MSLPESPLGHVHTNGPTYHRDYRFEMSGAHRKPAYEVGAPSITWHAGFWKPKAQPKDYKVAEKDLNDKEFREGTENEQNGESFANHSRWIKQIERLILHIFDALTEHQREHKRLFKLDYPGPDLTNLQPVAPRPARELYLLRGVYPGDRTRSDRYDSLHAIGCETHQHADNEKPGHQPRPSRYETVHIDGVWNSMPLDIRFEVSSEYFTISVTVDFSRMRPNPEGVKSRRRRLRKPDDEFQRIVPEYRVASYAMYRVIEQVNARRGLVSDASAVRKKDEDISELKCFTKYLFKTFWDTLKQEIVFGNSYQAYLKSKNQSSENYLGECFADFRNLTLQCNDRGEAVINPWILERIHADRHADGNGDHARKEARRKLNEMFSRYDAELIPEHDIKLVPDKWTERNLRDSIEGHFFKDDNIEWVDSIHPILLSLEPDEINNLAADPVEYTFTRFFHDRSIYGSGFGPQVDDGKEYNGDPLTYVLLFGYDEHRQMGRLVQRMNTLGTLRIAAIHDLPDTKHIFYHTLDDIEKKLRSLQGIISGQIDESGDAIRPKKKRDTLITYFRPRIRVFLNHIAPKYVELSDDTLQKAGEQNFRCSLNGSLRNLLDFLCPVFGAEEPAFEPEQTSRSKPPSRRSFKHLASVPGRLDEVHDLLYRFDSPFEVATGSIRPASSNLAGGLVPFRASRSKYYLDRFDELTKTLDSAPVLGFNPYDIFVHLRLDRAFSVFQVVADHFAILREKEVRLRHEWMSKRSEHHQSEIESLQRSAEVFFFLVLFPYYTSATLIHTLEKHSHEAGRAEDGLASSLAQHISNSLHLPWIGNSLNSTFQFLAHLRHQFQGKADDPFSIVFLCFIVSALTLVIFRPEVLRNFLKDLALRRNAITFVTRLPVMIVRVLVALLIYLWLVPVTLALFLLTPARLLLGAFRTAYVYLFPVMEQNEVPSMGTIDKTHRF
jgi:hypothetical protein